MNKKARAAAKSKMQWARDMLAREVVIAWLMKMGKKPPDKKRRHTEFAADLRGILEPKSVPIFKSKQEAASYVREVAKMVGGRDCLAPPKRLPMHVQRHITEKWREHRQPVCDSKRKAAQERITAKIAKADHEVAKHIEARREEMKRRLQHP